MYSSGVLGSMLLSPSRSYLAPRAVHGIGGPCDGEVVFPLHHLHPLAEKENHPQVRRAGPLLANVAVAL